MKFYYVISVLFLSTSILAQIKMDAIHYPTESDQQEQTLPETSQQQVDEHPEQYYRYGNRKYHAETIDQFKPFIP
jgi:hypothetical protein